MSRRIVFLFLFVILCTDVAQAAEPIRLRVLTEDASASQCVDGICTTVQVSRSTYSTGAVETVLVISAFDGSGNPIIPGTFTQIDSSAFVINRRGTEATLDHPMAFVTWHATGDYTEEAESATKVVDKRPSPFRGPTAFRVSEKEHRARAAAQGVAQAMTIDTDGIPTASGFGDAFLTIRRTTRVDRVLAPE
jgi:hypothetical protein